jgi:hypothetical protein
MMTYDLELGMELVFLRKMWLACAQCHGILSSPDMSGVLCRGRPGGNMEKMVGNGMVGSLSLK